MTEIEGVTVVYAPAFEGRGRLSTLLEAAWNQFTLLLFTVRLAAARATALVVHNPPDPLPAAVAARALGLSLIYDQNDDAPAMALARPGYARVRKVLAAMERGVVRRADVVITTSHEQRRRLETVYGVDATVIRVGGDGGNRARSANDGSGTTVFAYCGVIGEQDGVDSLVEAAAVLQQSHASGWRLEIAGDGPHGDSIRRRVRDLGLGHIVELHGWLTGRDLVSFYDRADVVVVPDGDSEYNHSCAMVKVITAAERGVPTVMRSLRENVSIVGGSAYVAGWTTRDLARAMEQALCATPAERAAVGRSAQAAIESTGTWANAHRRLFVDITLRTELSRRSLAVAS